MRDAKTIDPVPIKLQQAPTKPVADMIRAPKMGRFIVWAKMILVLIKHIALTIFIVVLAIDIF